MNIPEGLFFLVRILNSGNIRSGIGKEKLDKRGLLKRRGPVHHEINV